MEPPRREPQVVLVGSDLLRVIRDQLHLEAIELPAKFTAAKEESKPIDPNYILTRQQILLEIVAQINGVLKDHGEAI